MTDHLRRICAREYPTSPGGAFFNAASWGLLPRSAVEEVTDLTRRRELTHGFEERELGRIQHRCRSAIGRLLDVPETEIALAPNTSFGVSLAAAIVGAGEPGAIVVSEGEFQANVVPWKPLERKGFTVRTVPLDPRGLPDERALLAAVREPGVRALSVSAVQYASGYRADLAPLGEACREAGVLFCVDAIQALGVSPLRPNDVHADIVASGGQKWLCAPWGSGFVWVRSELHDAVDPPIVSWLGLEGSTDFDRPVSYELDWRPNARRFEPGTLGVQDYLGLARSVEIFEEIGIDEVRAHVLDVQGPLLEWTAATPSVRLWTPREDGRRAGIVSFFSERQDAAVAALEEIRTVFCVRGGAVRLSPHFYNTVEEMENVVRALDRVH